MLTTQPEKALGGPSLRYVIGVDEAGRGCMAGPVSMAAVCFAVNASTVPFTLDDSKAMTSSARDIAFDSLCTALSHDDPTSCAAHTLSALCRHDSNGRCCRLQSPLKHSERTVLGFASALVPAAVIDEVNILNATLEGMAEVCHTLVASLREAGEDLNRSNTVILIDGPHRPWTFLPPAEQARKLKQAQKRHENPPRCQGKMYPTTLQTMPCHAVIGGDGKYVSIATASVVAKVIRDAYADSVMATQCPLYGFAQHKGYCTAAHKEALVRYGLSVFHRREYAPVKAVLEAAAQGEKRAGIKRPRSTR